MNKTADNTPEGIVSAEEFLTTAGVHGSRGELRRDQLIYLLNERSRQIGEAVKRECAERVRLIPQECNVDAGEVDIDRDSIMNINVNDFIK